MLALRTRRGVLALAAATVLSVPAAASARTARYMVRITGTVTTNWERPEFSHSQDDTHIFWTESHGSETVRFHTRTTPALVARIGPFVAFRVGARTLNDPPRDLTAIVKIDRSSEQDSGSHPGPLGGTEALDPSPLFDCGKRSVPSVVTLSRDGGDLFIGAEADPLKRQPRSFGNCPISYPSEVPAATFPAFGSPLPISELFSSGKEIVIYQHTFTDHAPAGTPPFTTTSMVDWQATFVQIRSGRHS